jgi:hypothetical protein
MSNKRFVVKLVGPHWDDPLGAYEKTGGGTTFDLQEALVIGWTKASHKKWIEPLDEWIADEYGQYVNSGKTYVPYELIPVTIKINRE